MHQDENYWTVLTYNFCSFGYVILDAVQNCLSLIFPYVMYLNCLIYCFLGVWMATLVVILLEEGLWISKDQQLFIKNLGHCKQFLIFSLMRHYFLLMRHKIILMMSFSSFWVCKSLEKFWTTLGRITCWYLLFCQVVEHSYSCALERSFLYHGRMYVSAWHICFHSNVFSKQMKVNTSYFGTWSCLCKKLVCFWRLGCSFTELRLEIMIFLWNIDTFGYGKSAHVKSHSNYYVSKPSEDSFRNQLDFIFSSV